MKNIVLSILGLMLCGLMNGQITNEGFPKSWEMKSKQNVSPVVMPSFDLKKMQTEDVENDKSIEKPFRFGHEFKVDLGFKNAGSWDVLPNGDRIWRLQLISKGAKSINVVFNTYRVPTGATIYLYNNDRTDVLGAYTNVFNRPDEMLGTWMVAGENIWIEYYEPKKVSGQGELNLSRVVHGYRSITDIEVQEKALNDSGDCNRDVDCPIGNDFDSIKDRLKHSVAFIIMQGFVCSGNLINNTNNDRAPFFLTANHCDAGDESTWAFRFNWISPDPSCATTANSTDAVENQTTSGATRLATNSESDVRLLRLDGGLDDTWDLEFAGWDRSGDIPTGFTVGIHHPAGDIMKVCRDDAAPTKFIRDFNGNTTTEFWKIDDWDLGVTEGGSSGSALFDSKGRIIGQLAGGFAACNGTNDNGTEDWYGRFDVSWDFGTTDATRLSNWLDPQNTGQTTLNMLSEGNDSGGGDGDGDEVEGIILFPNPTEGMLMISNGSEAVLSYIVFDVFGKSVSEGRVIGTSEIDLTLLSSGMYFVYIENISEGGDFTRKIIVR